MASHRIDKSLTSNRNSATGSVHHRRPSLKHHSPAHAPRPHPSQPEEPAYRRPNYVKHTDRSPLRRNHGLAAPPQQQHGPSHGYRPVGRQQNQHAYSSGRTSHAHPSPILELEENSGVDAVAASINATEAEGKRAATQDHRAATRRVRHVSGGAVSVETADRTRAGAVNSKHLVISAMLLPTFKFARGISRATVRMRPYGRATGRARPNAAASNVGKASAAQSSQGKKNLSANPKISIDPAASEKIDNPPMYSNAKSGGVLRKISCKELGGRPPRKTSIDECAVLLMPTLARHAADVARVAEQTAVVGASPRLRQKAESAYDEIKNVSQSYSVGYADQIKRNRSASSLQSVPENGSIENGSPLSKRVSSNSLIPPNVPPLPIVSAGRERWNWVKKNRKKVIEYGVSEGILRRRSKTDDAHVIVVEPTPAEKQEDKLNEKWGKPKDDGLNIPVNDAALIYEAIPHLPIVPALICLFCNIVVPGSGTVLSGWFLLCCGLPRLQVKEGRIALTIIVNTMVGISQFCTITFLLVGWFWSISWGAHFIYHSTIYRKAQKEKRQADIATAALEAITKDGLTRRKDVQDLIHQENLVREKTGGKMNPNGISPLMRAKKERTVAPCRRPSEAPSGQSAALSSPRSPRSPRSPPAIDSLDPVLV